MMDDAKLQVICDYFEFGVLGQWHTLKGGRSHVTYALTTDRGKFVIKQLQNHYHLPISLELFRNTAAITHLFASKDIPAITPLIKHNDVILEYDDNYFMAFPFVDARMLLNKQYSVDQCYTIGQLLARIHLINPDIPAAPAWKFHYHPQEWQHAYDFFVERHVFSIAPRLKRMDAVIEQCFKHYERLATDIIPDVVVSHRDVDPHNILWHPTGDCAIIDWDLAGKIDAAVEWMYVALGFGRKSATEFVPQRFSALLKGYTSLRPLQTTQVEPLIYATLCNWLMWCQKQMHKLTLGQNDLATANDIAVGVRYSLTTVEYIISMIDTIKALWDECFEEL